MSAALIFGLLFALMLTGMPISISLGLTVLTFLFTMTEVPIESVGLKLFSGLDNFGIMAIPFFILAGTFLTRGGVARRMIAFTTSLVGHLPPAALAWPASRPARCSRRSRVRALQPWSRSARS
ncbi:TRAP-type mannitol/chloroaromatic compound transport system permease large subunit [Bradyrhizobium sp. USDA 4461]